LFIIPPKRGETVSATYGQTLSSRQPTSQNFQTEQGENIIPVHPKPGTKTDCTKFQNHKQKCCGGNEMAPKGKVDFKQFLLNVLINTTACFSILMNKILAHANCPLFVFEFLIKF
jgi:hypothetical protein